MGMCIWITEKSTRLRNREIRRPCLLPVKDGILSNIERQAHRGNVLLAVVNGDVLPEADAEEEDVWMEETCERC